MEGEGGMQGGEREGEGEGGREREGLSVGTSLHLFSVSSGDAGVLYMTNTFGAVSGQLDLTVLGRDGEGGREGWGGMGRDRGREGGREGGREERGRERGYS